MYVGWEDIPDSSSDLPADLQQLYLAEHLPFDPAIARAVRDHGIIPSVCVPGRKPIGVKIPRHRWWQWARRQASWYGTIDATMETVLAPPCEDSGMAWKGTHALGRHLIPITLLHHAEFVAQLRHKATVSLPVSQS